MMEMGSIVLNQRVTKDLIITKADPQQIHVKSASRSYTLQVQIEQANTYYYCYLNIIIIILNLQHSIRHIEKYYSEGHIHRVVLIRWFFDIFIPMGTPCLRK